MRQTLLRALTLLTLSLIAGVVDAGVRPIRLSLGKDEQPPAGPTPIEPEALQGFTGYITLEQAVALHTDPTTTFLDASSPDDHRAGRIPGAFSLPPDALAGGAWPELLAEIPRDFQVVVYCQTSQCDAADLVALKMQEFGFPLVCVFKDGLAAWKAAGHPVQAGS